MEEMTIFQAIIYGIVQGIGEFLPISSSGHLAIIPFLTGWQDPGLAFDIALHLGTLIAVILYFFRDWITLITAGITKPKTTNGKLFWYLVLATIPAGIIGLLLDDKIEAIRETNQGGFTILIGTMLILVGIILYIADKKTKITKKDVNKISLKDSIIIGTSQALAVLPGTSRSGITIATGLFRGLSKEVAARFSFLLSTPIIAAAGLLSIKDLSKANINMIPFIIAILTSAITGFLCIKFLLKFLQKHGLKPFVIYRVILGIILITLVLI